MTLSRLLLDTLCLNPGSGAVGDWNTVDLSGLGEVVQFEAGALWLHRRMRDHDVVVRSDSLGRFVAHLVELARRTSAQNMLVMAEAARVACALREAGLHPVFLKGTARQALASELPFADARPVHDVDVLVSAPEVDAAWDCLARVGFKPAANAVLTPTGHYHRPPVEHDAGVSVEIHRSTSSRIPADEAWGRATRRVQWASDLPVMADPTELLWHSVTHAMTDGADAYRLRYLLDAASILAADVSVHWATVRDRLASAELTDPARAAAWLLAAGDLAGHLPSPDAGIQPGRPFPLERLLRWRLHVARSVGLESRWGRKLNSAATRIEAGLGYTETDRNAALLLRLRDRIVSRIARFRYTRWRRNSGVGKGPTA